MQKGDDFLSPHTKEAVDILPHQVNTSQAVVCVIVIAYRHEQYIKACLDSILAQETDFPYYIFIAEDDSPDNTRAICTAYAKQFPDKIVLAHNHRDNNISLNGRPSARHNYFHALLASESKYVAFCEGDDAWNNPLKLQKQVDFLEAHDDFNLSYTNSDVANSTDKPLSLDKFQTSAAFDFNFQQSVQAKNGPTLTIVFKRDRLDLAHYFNLISESAMGDWPLELLLSLTGEGHHHDFTSAVYNRRSKGSTLLYLAKPYVYYDSRISFIGKLLTTTELSTNQLRFLHRFHAKNLFIRASIHFKEGKFTDWTKDQVSAVRSWLQSNPISPLNVDWVTRYRWISVIKLATRIYGSAFKQLFR